MRHATDSAYQRDQPTSQMRLADNWSQIPANAEDGVQAVVLVSIDHLTCAANMGDW